MDKVSDRHFWNAGEIDEHLDDLICGSADCLDRRLHCVPRGGRTDSPIAGIRGDLADPAFCPRQTDCLTGLVESHGCHFIVTITPKSSSSRPGVLALRDEVFRAKPARNAAWIDEMREARFGKWPILLSN